MTTPFIVNGSHGTIIASPVDGKVIDYTPVDPTRPAYADILQFDLVEWKNHYHQEIDGLNVDILDLGYWLADGSYSEPEEDFRQELSLMRAEG